MRVSPRRDGERADLRLGRGLLAPRPRRARRRLLQLLLRDDAARARAGSARSKFVAREAPRCACVCASVAARGGELVGQIARAHEREELAALHAVAAIDEHRVEVAERLRADVGLRERAQVDRRAAPRRGRRATRPSHDDQRRGPGLGGAGVALVARRAGARRPRPRRRTQEWSGTTGRRPSSDVYDDSLPSATIAIVKIVIAYQLRAGEDPPPDPDPRRGAGHAHCQGSEAGLRRRHAPARRRGRVDAGVASAGGPRERTESGPRPRSPWRSRSTRRAFRGFSTTSRNKATSQGAEIPRIAGASMSKRRPRGERRYRAILPEVIRGVDQALDPLSESERRVLRDLLRKVVAQDPEWKSPATNGGGAR